jgi:hypothetical protein
LRRIAGPITAPKVGQSGHLVQLDGGNGTAGAVAAACGNAPEILSPSLSHRDAFRKIPTDAGVPIEPVADDTQATADSSKSAGKSGLLTLKAGSDSLMVLSGEVAERLNAPVSKTGIMPQ